MVKPLRPDARLLLPFIFLLCTACAPSFVVNSPEDQPDRALGDGLCETDAGTCTLRAAIEEGNSARGAVILFEDITTISPATPLPSLTGGNIKIHGAGAVTLVGPGGGCEATLFAGLNIVGSSSNEIQGLTIRGFGTGIAIHGAESAATSNLVGAPQNTSSSNERNVIGGNCRGVVIEGQHAHGNTVAGNYIGTDFAGLRRNPNYLGIHLFNAAHDNQIGATCQTELPPKPLKPVNIELCAANSLARNLVSGNYGEGIYLSGASANHITGNYIGLTHDGLHPLGNGAAGIYLTDGSNGNIVGIDGDGHGSANVIGSNGYDGVYIQRSSGNVVAGNYIGTDATGTIDRGNDGEGVFIGVNAHGNLIGTNGDGLMDLHEGNLISGNARAGVWPTGPNNVVAGNYIGTNFDASAALGNSGPGIQINSDGNRIEINVISGNYAEGIYIGAAFNTISGNLIGTNATGMLAVDNLRDGIYISSAAHDNLIADANVISVRSGAAGLRIWGDYNTVSGNYIGTDAGGKTSLGFAEYGVALDHSASCNVVTEDSNIISSLGADVAVINHATSTQVAELSLTCN